MAFLVDEKDKAKIIALISLIFPDVKIYLFGSRARGTNAQWSDIDLALDAGQRLPTEIIGEIKSILEASWIPYKVDVVDLYLVSEPMKQAILKDKIIWKN